MKQKNLVLFNTVDSKFLITKLKQLGIQSKEEYMTKAFSRNIGIFSEDEQKKLSNAKIAIAGMGGVGGVHLITAICTGITRFHIADFDIFELVNVNRQLGATVPDFGKPKLKVMVKHALAINPYINIKQFNEGLNSSNIDDFLDGVQVVLDGLDFFAFNTRRLLFNKAREKGVYVITAGPLGFSSAMLIFSPHEGMSFDEYFNIVDGMSEWEQQLSFFIGIAPKATHLKYMDLSKVDLEAKAGPSLNIGCQICSAMAITEVIRILLGKKGIKPVPYYFQFDPYVKKYYKRKLHMGNRNPVQYIKKIITNFVMRRNLIIQKTGTPLPLIDQVNLLKEIVLRKNNYKNLV